MKAAISYRTLYVHRRTDHRERVGEILLITIVFFWSGIARYRGRLHPHPSPLKLFSSEHATVLHVLFDMMARIKINHEIENARQFNIPKKRQDSEM